MNKKEKIEKKLTVSFFKVSAITAAAAILGIIALVFISARYSYALHNFGFAQGDIGTAVMITRMPSPPLQNSMKS